MIRTLFAAIILLLTTACDAEPTVANNAGTAAAKDGKGTPGVTVSVTAGGAGRDVSAGAPAPAGPDGKFTSLSSCLQSCEDSKMLPTNHATCRLNCDASYGAQPQAVVAGGYGDPIGDAMSCLGRCYAVDSPPACATGCKNIAEAATPGPAKDVLDRLDTCMQTCHADKSASATNSATCALNCGQLARVAGPAQPSATP